MAHAFEPLMDVWSVGGSPSFDGECEVRMPYEDEGEGGEDLIADGVGPIELAFEAADLLGCGFVFGCELVLKRLE